MPAPPRGAAGRPALLAPRSRCERSLRGRPVCPAGTAWDYPRLSVATASVTLVVIDLLAEAEQSRVAALASLDAGTQAGLGQFFTPARAAALIASMPRLPETGDLRVLDPGAGTGMLTAALVTRVLNERPGLTLHVVAVERDETVLPYLMQTLDAGKSAGDGRMTYEVVAGDFIMASTGLEADPRLVGFDLVIQNPPYAKLAASSPHRQAVKQSGGDAPNLYAAFLAIAAAALRPGGQLVAITPRSFFNGPYFGAFRSYLLDHIALDRVHVFESRSTVFADTGVLQENVVFSGTRDGERDSVTLSVSNGHEDDAAHRAVPYAEVVHPDDPYRFIRLATNENDTETAEVMLSLPCSLRDLAVEVSTGRVGDFRSRDALLTQPTGEAHPLIYPGNLHGGGFVWPRGDIRKTQWFAPADAKDHMLLLPEGWYCVVKRFSAKEERRRIVASVWSPEQVPGPVAFENHLNVFHSKGAGLDETTARGLAHWLNSTFVDRFFRMFSGHTQVNATDLRTLRFPTRETLRRLGGTAAGGLSQDDVDRLISGVIQEIRAAA
jgi:adenine-specific DNA-methyltransferase